MKKIDYISLSRHFSGEATDTENQMVFRWKDSNPVNLQLYERLSTLYHKDNKSLNNIDSEYVKSVWNKIISKVLEE